MSIRLNIIYRQGKKKDRHLSMLAFQFSEKSPPDFFCAASAETIASIISTTVLSSDPMPLDTFASDSAKIRVLMLAAFQHSGQIGT
jgi:hypothetical protein